MTEAGNNSLENRQVDGNAQENVKKVRQKKFWDKRIVLATQISLTIISFLFFIIGKIIENNMMEGIASNCFTAFIVTLLFTIIDWKTETDVERAMNSTQEETEKRIESVQNTTKSIINQLRESNDQLTAKLQSSLDNLSIDTQQFSKELQDFRRVVELYSGKSCTFCKNNIKSVKFNREDCDLESFFGIATKTICLLATNLESFTQYLPIFKKKAREGVSIKVATIHPNFARYFNISNIVGYTGPHKRWRDMTQSLLEFVDCRESLEKDKQELFEIRTYSTITPTLILMISDNNCYVSYLLHGHRSRETPHFQFSGEEDNVSPYYNFRRHFDGIWNDKGTIIATRSSVNKLEFFVGWNEAEGLIYRGYNLKDIYDILCQAWCKETCTERMRNEWSSDKPYIGQCTVTAFLLQDLFGGEVYGFRLSDGFYHSYNVIKGNEYDLTSQQFPPNTIDYKNKEIQSRKEHFAQDNKEQRYNMLKDRFNHIIDELDSQSQKRGLEDEKTFV